MQKKTGGFTLIELLVGLGVAAVITMAGVAFASHQIRSHTTLEERRSLQATGQAALDLLRHELKRAGTGLPMGEDGVFLGVRTGSFWGSYNAAAGSGSQDLGLRFAAGKTVTVVDVGAVAYGSQLEFCRTDSVNESDLKGPFVLANEAGTLGRTVEFTPSGASGVLASTPCGSCLHGCSTRRLATAPASSTGGMSSHWADAPDTTNASYRGGRATFGYEAPVYTIENSRLLRITEDAPNGVVIADGAVGLYFQVREWTEAGGWQVADLSSELVGADVRRIVDIELILEGAEDAQGPQPPITSELSGDAFPVGDPDKKQRQSFRASVALRNAGGI